MRSLIWTSILAAAFVGSGSFAQAPEEAAETSAPAAAASRPQASGNKFPLPEDARFGVQTMQGMTGQLAVQAVQGTPGGPPIGSVPVKVQLVHRGAVVHNIEQMLDEHGVVVIEDLPVGISVLPVVQIEYAGVTYQQPGPTMDATNRGAAVEVVCYEVTEETPPWAVRMRHVVVDRAAEGIRVNEIIVIDNPSARTWLGRTNPSGRQVTTVFALPPDAKDVQLGRGFHDWCCTTYEHGRLVSHLPLMPETTELHFSYALPARNGAARVVVAAPAETAQMMLVVPDDLQPGTAEGLQRGGGQTVGERPVHYYHASNLADGEDVSLLLTGLSAPTGELAESSGSAAKVVALIGAGLAVLLVLIMIIPRRRHPARSEGEPGISS